MFTKEETNLQSTADLVGYTPPLGSTLHSPRMLTKEKTLRQLPKVKLPIMVVLCLTPYEKNWKGMQCKS
jgi:hypothetical protein